MRKKVLEMDLNSKVIECTKASSQSKMNDVTKRLLQFMLRFILEEVIRIHDDNKFLLNEIELLQKENNELKNNVKKLELNKVMVVDYGQ